MMLYEDAMADMMRFVDNGADYVGDDADDKDEDIVVCDGGLPCNDDEDIEDPASEIDSEQDVEEHSGVINRKPLTKKPFS